MTRVLAALAALLFAAALTPATVTVHAASAKAMPSHVTLNVAAKFAHDMHFAHVMAGAKLTYAAHDIVVNLTADNLPMPSVVHENVYVLWATNGKQKENLGALHISGKMAGLKAQTMMMHTQDLVVTAEKSAHVMHPAGPTILSAMI